MEEVAPYRSEFVDGEVFAMSGGTEPHSLISGNLLAELHRALRGKPYRVHGPLFRLWIARAKMETYPDVSVICGETKLVPGRLDVYTNPLVIGEVLSESTEEYDRGLKFARYKKLGSLRQYVLVSQSVARVESFTVGADGQWVGPLVIEGLDGEVDFPPLGCAVAMREIYLNVFA